MALCALMSEKEVCECKGQVQFNCDFLHLPASIPVLLGVVGIDDLAHRDWPTTFIISRSESGGISKKVIGRIVELIDAHRAAVKGRALIDGSGALESACKELGVLTRSYFSHITRMPMKRGGEKRGSKGSLARYIYSNIGIPYKHVAKIVGDALLANCVLPKYRTDFTAFISLLLERHEDCLGTNEVHKEHLLSRYFSRSIETGRHSVWALGFSWKQQRRRGQRARRQAPLL